MPTTRPEDFFTSAPPRIIGTECEYDPHRRNSGLPQLPTALPKATVKHFGHSFFHGFYSNGARIYPDQGHQEYAAPESLGPLEATATDLGGVLIVAHAAAEQAKTSVGKGLHVFRRSGTYAPRSGVKDLDFATKGYHENYLVPELAPRSYQTLQMLVGTLLATRVWAGSGIVTPDGYRFFQKTHGLSRCGVSHGERTFHGNKPWILIQEGDDTVRQGSGWFRCEVRYADPGLSPIAQYVSKAAVSLVLRLVEHQELFDSDELKAACLADPAGQAPLINADLSCTRRHLTLSNHTETVFGIQEQLLSLVRKLSTEFSLPPDEQQAIELWQDFIDDLRLSDPENADYPERLLQRAHFAVKHYRLCKLAGDTALSCTNTQDFSRDMGFDAVYPHGTGMRYFAQIDTSDILPEAMVDELTRRPPQKTRARLRGESIAKDSEHLTSVGWGYVKKTTPGQLYLSNPYSDPNYEVSTQKPQAKA